MRSTRLVSRRPRDASRRILDMSRPHATRSSVSLPHTSPPPPTHTHNKTRTTPTTTKAAHADAFSNTPYRGNPASVVRLRVGQDIPDDKKLQIASEMNLSETAFLEPRAPNEYGLRWFTPTSEVDLCGHGTLASAHVLWELDGADSTRPLQFHTRSGLLVANRDERGFIELDFPEEPATELAADHADRAALLPAFGLEASDVLWVGRNRMDVIAEVTPAAFARLRPQSDAICQIETRVVSITAAGNPLPMPEGVPAAGEYDFSSRAFGPLVGIEEDPVCGSAHCCLGPYWSAKLGKREMLARAASPRGGDVAVRLEGQRVILGGQAVVTLAGELTHS